MTYGGIPPGVQPYPNQDTANGTWSVPVAGGQSAVQDTGCLFGQGVLSLWGALTTSTSARVWLGSTTAAAVEAPVDWFLWHSSAHTNTTINAFIWITPQKRYFRIYTSAAVSGFWKYERF